MTLKEIAEYYNMNYRTLSIWKTKYPTRYKALVYYYKNIVKSEQP